MALPMRTPADTLSLMVHRAAIRASPFESPPSPDTSDTNRGSCDVLASLVLPFPMAAKASLWRGQNRTPLSPAEPKIRPSSIVREDEPQLVAAAKAGDASAFEELVNRYEHKIYRVTLHITQNAEDAEDAMQEAFVKAYQHLGNFQGDSRFYTWLVRIAVNESLMR